MIKLLCHLLPFLVSYYNNARAIYGLVLYTYMVRTVTYIEAGINRKSVEAQTPVYYICV